jgi:uncharacterized membrane protein
MENTEKVGPSFVSRIVAAVVLALGALILFKVLAGFLAALFGILLIVVAVIAVIWAVRTLF